MHATEIINSTVPVLLTFCLAYLYDMSKKLGKISETIAAQVIQAKTHEKRIDRIEQKVYRKRVKNAL